MRLWGDDHLGTRFDRRREHVPVVGIGQLDRLKEGLVPGDKTVAYCLVHEVARAGQLLRVEVWPVGGEAAEDLVEDLIAPLDLHQPGLGNADQQVSERARVEHVGVVQDDERHLRAGPSLG